MQSRRIRISRILPPTFIVALLRVSDRLVKIPLILWQQSRRLGAIHKSWYWAYTTHNYTIMALLFLPELPRRMAKVFREMWLSGRNIFIRSYLMNWGPPYEPCFTVGVSKIERFCQSGNTLEASVKSVARIAEEPVLCYGNVFCRQTVYRERAKSGLDVFKYASKRNSTFAICQATSQPWKLDSREMSWWSNTLKFDAQWRREVYKCQNLRQDRYGKQIYSNIFELADWQGQRSVVLIGLCQKCFHRSAKTTSFFQFRLSTTQLVRNVR